MNTRSMPFYGEYIFLLHSQFKYRAGDSLIHWFIILKLHAEAVAWPEKKGTLPQKKIRDNTGMAIITLQRKKKYVIIYRDMKLPNHI